MSTPTPETDVDAATKRAEAADAERGPDPGPEPTPEEERAAERAAPVDDSVREAYEEQLGRGGAGEGRPEVADDGRPPLSG